MTRNQIYNNIFITIMLVTLVWGYSAAHPVPNAEANDQVAVPTATPTPQATTEAHIIIVGADVKPIVKPTATPKPMTVPEKIDIVFGKDHIMKKVAFCESSFNPNAKSNQSTATGVFQIIKGTWKHHKCEGDRTDEDANIACAKKIYDKRGLVDWNASKHCWSSKGGDK